MAALLVVTSRPNVGDVLVGPLRSLGVEVAVAANAEHAARLASQLRPDVIFVDPALSAMERWHTSKRLCAEPATARVPVHTLPKELDSEVGVQRILEKVRAARAERWSRPDEPARAEPADRTDVRAPGTPLGSRGERVLVVDDTATNREPLVRRLEKKGYEVHPVESGEEAVRELERGRFDLVLLDWTMPGLSGLEVLAWIRERHSPFDLPVIMTTARSDADDVVDALRAGANDYVAKPLNFDIVHARMRTHLRQAELYRELTASERRYRALLENTGDLVVQFRQSGEVLYVSPASRTLLGVAPDALQARPFLDWLHPDDRRGLERSLRGGWPAACTFLARMERADGEWIWVETSARIVREGGAALVQAACRDVSELLGERAARAEASFELLGEPPVWTRSTAEEREVQPEEPSRNGASAGTPVVLTLLVGDFESVSHEDLAALVSAELHRVLGAKP